MMILPSPNYLVLNFLPFLIITAIGIGCKKASKLDLLPSRSPDDTAWVTTVVRTDSAKTIYICGYNTLYSLNAQTGSQNWKQVFNFNTTASPIYSNGMVYLGGGDGKLYAYDTAGAFKWAIYTGDTAVLSSPVVSEGMVLVYNTVNVLAINATSGAIMWKCPITSNGEDFTSGVAVYNSTVYISTYTLYAIDLKTGVIKWSKANIDVCLPKIYNNKIYTFERSINNIVALDVNTGNEIWAQYSEGFNGLSANVAYGFAYFYTDAGLSVVDTATGITKWAATFPAQGYVSQFQAGSSPVVTDSIVNLVGESVTAFNAITGGGMPGYGPNIIDADVTVINGYSYFGTVLNGYGFYNTHYGYVYEVQLSSGGNVWENTTQESYTTTPCVVTKSGKIYRAGDVY